MGAYKNFLIGNQRFGLEEGLAPWLLPQDAWATMKNCYLRRGVLNKRNGLVVFDRFVHAVADEAIGALGSTHYTGTLVKKPIRAGDLSFDDGTLTITDVGDGTLSGGGTGTIVYTTGVYDITFSGITTGPVVADYDYYPGLSIVGIEGYANLTMAETDLMIFDKRRCGYYDPTAEKIEDICGVDTWTGGNFDYFWGCNARNRLYITNNVDRVKYFDGTPWANLLMDIDGNATNDVDTCLLIFSYKERIVALRTAENGTLYPQRARWCKPENHGDWTNDGYVDAPTNDWIMTADFVGEDLIVWFENSTWRLKYTGDAELPFRWEILAIAQGSSATYSGFNYKDVMAVVGAVSIVETDNLRVYDIDEKVPDAVIGFDQSQFGKIYSIPIQELQQVIISYPEVDDTENTKSLCYNYTDFAWSRYDYGFNVYGFHKEGESGLTLDEIDETFDELEIAFDDPTRQAGYPITLGGDTSGYIWKINYGGTDGGSAISFEAFSGRWNPFLKEGYRARFGWIEFLVDRDPTISMTVEFYAHIGGKESLVASETVTFGETGDDVERIWVRADNGAVGDFHRVKLTNNAANQTIRLHALMIYMKPAGRMK